jgi:hypothetical protein
MTIDPMSIAHRVRCVTTRLGLVVRCPQCRETTFEGFEFDGRRDPLVGNHTLCDPRNPEQIAELLEALLDMGGLVERTCPTCAAECDQ